MMNKKVNIMLIFLLMISLISAAYYGDTSRSTQANSNIGISTTTSSNTNTDVSGSSNNNSSSEGRSGISIGSDVNVDSEVTVKTSGSVTTVLLSDGREAIVMISSVEARERAESSLKIDDCSNCEVKLTEEKVNGEQHAVYEVRTQKESKVFGLFKSHMNVEASVDAETGDIIDTEKPWWSFLAVESRSSIGANANSESNAEANSGGSGLGY